MACESRVPQGMSPVQRAQQISQALKKLEAMLKAGAVKVKVGANGAVAFVGWADRSDVTDACAFRVLSSRGSWELRQAVAKAEAMAGRKVDVQVVAAGVHSHDGGKTWGKH